MLSERAKLGLLSLLLLLMLGLVAFTTMNTFQAARSFQQQHTAIKKEDVSAIRPWMTIHVISYIYHVPEDYLYCSLNINNAGLPHHVTLYQTASRKRQPVDQVIHTIQHAILAYHNEHHAFCIPSTAPLLHAIKPGRVKY